MTKAKWLFPDRLCTFDEKVRVEIGAQLIELDCTDENLRNEVTSPHYKIGQRDAYGRVIRPAEAEKPMDPTGFGVVEKGEKMACIDYREKHVPHLWMVYQWQKTDDGEKFIKVDEFEDKNAALKYAEQLAVEMG